jgi:deoxyribonuclease V
MTDADGLGWPADAVALAAEQVRLAVLEPPRWRPGPSEPAVGGCFVAYGVGEAGPGRAGDRAWVGAAVVAAGELIGRVVVPGVTGGSYRPGLLALREGAMLAAAVRALDVPLDVLLVDATGRDHPRRAGLALHLGAALDLPTIGVTHRPLRAAGPEPGPRRGDWSPLELDGEEVARWVRTRERTRPVVVHAAWRTTPAIAAGLVVGLPGHARTPEPLRLAREAARVARSSAAARGAT